MTAIYRLFRASPLKLSLIIQMRLECALQLRTQRNCWMLISGLVTLLFEIGYSKAINQHDRLWLT